MLGTLVHFLRLPGFVRPFSVTDPQSGAAVRLRVSPRYAVLTVGSTEFYFLRESGRFDGTGYLSDGAEGLAGLTAERMSRTGQE